MYYIATIFFNNDPHIDDSVVISCLFFQVTVDKSKGLSKRELDKITKLIPKYYYGYEDDVLTGVLADTLDKYIPGNNWQVMREVDSFSLDSSKYVHLYINNAYSILIYKS